MAKSEELMCRKTGRFRSLRAAQYITFYGFTVTYYFYFILSRKEKIL